MVWSYARFVEAPAAAGLVFSFPTPTALMLYLLWPAPVVFLVLYVRAFDDWVVDEAALARFRAIVAERRKAAGTTDRPEGGS